MADTRPIRTYVLKVNLTGSLETSSVRTLSEIDGVREVVVNQDMDFVQIEGEFDPLELIFDTMGMDIINKFHIKVIGDNDDDNIDDDVHEEPESYVDIRPQPESYVETRSHPESYVFGIPIHIGPYGGAVAASEQSYAEIGRPTYEQMERIENSMMDMALALTRANEAHKDFDNIYRILICSLLVNVLVFCWWYVSIRFS